METQRHNEVLQEFAKKLALLGLSQDAFWSIFFHMFRSSTMVVGHVFPHLPSKSVQ